MTFCYADESGTDSNLPVAVVAGLLFDCQGHFWFDVEWAKIRDRHGVAGRSIHMREFTPHGQFKDLTDHSRLRLFAELVTAINAHKLISLAATLTAEQYRLNFKGLTKLSMYAACFANLMMLSGTGLEKYGPHRWPLSFVLDDGNAYKGQIVSAGLPVLLRAFPHVATVDFLPAASVNALQAADVVTWAVRRDLSGLSFPLAFQPLTDLFAEHHLNMVYKDEWMQGVADKIRASESGDNGAS